jgi:2-polyprenyl-3-methyl-5-hydroxy-6-metoxy-1,4-benzoquinol methylase
MENKSFVDSHDSYYNLEKTRFVNLVPEGPNVVLDIGCAAGRLGRTLLELRRAVEVIGVEIYGPAADEAAKCYTMVYKEDIEHLNLPYKGYFDFVVCGDILEHLSDPLTLVKKIHVWIKTGGYFIASVPNIRYWRVLRDLIIFGKWEYVEAGILDNTHLRFFTQQSFLRMIENGNFKIVDREMIINGRKQNLLNKITFGMFKEFLGSQIMIVAMPTNSD